MTLQLNNATNNVQIDFDAGAGTNRTVTFPDADGTVALAGAAGGLAGNISRATNFRLTENVTANNTVLGSWAQAGGLPNGVTVSGGEFTVPETGIWLIVLVAQAGINETDSNLDVIVERTNDGVNFAEIAFCKVGGNTANQNQAGASGTCCVISDVTDTGDNIFRFTSSSLASGSSINGDATRQFTSVLFLRLGDT